MEVLALAKGRDSPQRYAAVRPSSNQGLLMRKEVQVLLRVVRLLEMFRDRL